MPRIQWSNHYLILSWVHPLIMFIKQPGLCIFCNRPLAGEATDGQGNVNSNDSHKQEQPLKATGNLIHWKCCLF